MSNQGGSSTRFVSLGAIFWSFFKIGAFTFGGGWAMIPLIRAELVDRRRWVDGREFVDMLAIAQSSPGPIAINTSVISGYKLRGLPGALLATLGSSLPSFLVILLVATVFLPYRDSRGVEAVFRGMRPAIFGLLVAAVRQVGSKSVTNRLDAGFLAVAAVLLLVARLHPIIVVTLAAAGGLAVGRIRRARTRKAGGAKKDVEPE